MPLVKPQLEKQLEAEIMKAFNEVFAAEQAQYGDMSKYQIRIAKAIAKGVSKAVIDHIKSNAFVITDKGTGKIT